MFALLCVCCTRPSEQTPVQASAQVGVPTVPSLSGLQVQHPPESIFGGHYALLRVGPLSRTALSSRPLLLVHGLGDRGMADYFWVLEALAKDREVLAVDLPGFGQSSRGPHAYSPAEYAAFLSEVVTTQAHGPVDVMGHSLGASIVIEFAGKYPHQLSQIVLLDAAGILHRQSLLFELQHPATKQPPSRFDQLRSDLVKGALGVTSRISPDPGRVISNEPLRKAVLGSSPSSAAALSLASHNFDPALRGVDATTLLLWGEHDQVAPLRTYEVLRERLPVQESQLLSGVGHNPLQQSPEAVASRVAAFLDWKGPRRLEQKRQVSGPWRVGECINQASAVFTGTYESIVLRHCRAARISNSVVTHLEVEHSNVELTHVTVEEETVIRESNLRATGSLFLGSAALHLDASVADLAGVEVVGQACSLSSGAPSRVLASVSGLQTLARGRTSLHGRTNLAEHDCL